jgi:hypothetical protein
VSKEVNTEGKYSLALNLLPRANERGKLYFLDPGFLNGLWKSSDDNVLELPVLSIFTGHVRRINNRK